MEFGSQQRQERSYSKMEDKSRLLKIRNLLKKRKPTFVKQCSHKIKSLSSSWRKPKGIQSKMRLKHKGKRRSPSLGWSSPSKVKGLTREGLVQVRAERVADLKGLGKEHAVIIASVGMKRKLKLLQDCKKNSLNVTNVKDIQSAINEIQSIMEERKQFRKGYEEGRKKKDDTSKKKKADSKKEEKKEEEAPKEETKKGDKSDKIKVLEKRQ
jgi:large subunit ribosomal protein L32e